MPRRVLPSDTTVSLKLRYLQVGELDKDWARFRRSRGTTPLLYRLGLHLQVLSGRSSRRATFHVKISKTSFPPCWPHTDRDSLRPLARRLVKQMSPWIEKVAKCKSSHPPSPAIQPL